jgi:beta-glucuronidase
MKKNSLISLIFFSIAIISRDLFCQSPLITGTVNRKTESLNGKWHYIIDPYETGYYNYRYQPYDEMEHSGNRGFYRNIIQTDKSELIEYDFDKSPTLLVPGDWNTQDEKLMYYEGTIWYKKSFDYRKDNSSNRIYIYFGAANYQADVYLNGQKLGRHIGGFTPFNFEVTDIIKDTANFIVVKVDNKRKREGVPTLNTDWWNYGGLTRDVKIIEVPQTFIRDYVIQLKKDSRDILAGYVQLDGNNLNNVTVEIQIPEAGIKHKAQTDENGNAIVEIKTNKLVKWSPGNPKLYDVSVRTDNDIINERIGFRSVITKGTGILLNGQPVFLKGVSIHEENVFRGNRAYSEEDARMLLGWVKELNGNFARLAHYPHNEYMSRIADEMGIMLWEEIPVYWTIEWENEDTYDNARSQLREVISRDKNRASVIFWSVGNETPVTETRIEFMTSLIAEARKLDNTRLISAALEQHGLEENRNIRVITDPLADYVDVLSFNEYIGWYDGLPDNCLNITWQIEQNKPVVISEFGAGALQGFHGDRLTRWTEEFQEDLYRKTLDMLVKIPQLRGMTPWILCDFRSPRRPLPVIQDGWNRKGLISQAGNKKKAFYVLKDFYENFELNR